MVRPPYRMHHLRGKDPCGNLAFYMLRKPAFCELAKSEDVLLIDGTPMLKHSPVICGSCGKPITELRSDDVVSNDN